MRANFASRFGRIVVVLLVCGFAAFPVYWMINTATSTNQELYSTGQSAWIDFSSLLQVFQVLTMEGPLRWLRNSAFVATGTTILSLLMAVLVGYSISRFRFRGKGVLGFVLFMTQMMPEALLVVPLYTIFVTLGLINGLAGLVLANTAFAMPVAVWIVKSALDR